MSPEHRRMVSELVIAASACAAVQLAVVQPVERDALDADAALHQARAHAAASASSRPDQSIADRAALADRLAAFSAPARDQTILYATVSRLATRRQITLERLDAAVAPSPSSVRASDDPLAPTALAYTLEAAGDYADLVRFIRDLERDLGLVCLRHARLLPLDPERPQAASLRLRFELLDAPALARSTDSAEQTP